jgi:hypothetical protein
MQLFATASAVDDEKSIQMVAEPWASSVPDYRFSEPGIGPTAV